MIREPMHVLSVELRPNPAGRRQLWRITMEDGLRYATSDMWIASLCQQAFKLQRKVKVFSASGWYYRELTHVEMEPEQVAS